MRGTSTPRLVDVTSSSEDALGVVVPMPAAPVEGNVLVWAKEILLKKITKQASEQKRIVFFPEKNP